MWKTGFDSKLKNAVYCEIIKLSQTGLPNHFISMLHDKSSKETVDYICDAQQKWNDKLRRSLTALSVERKLSFIKEITLNYTQYIHQRTFYTFYKLLRIQTVV